MRVHLTSASGQQTGLAVSALRKVEECARLDRFGVHTTTDNANEADLILFVETDQGIGPFATKLLRHPLVRRMPDRCFAYNSSDNPVALLPGLYASIDKERYDPTRVRTTHYLSTHITVPERRSKPMRERTLLYSFVGDARNAQVRRDLLSLTSARGKCIDTSSQVDTVWNDPARRNRFVDNYASILSDTKFALCPRGCGPASMRLFEAMRVGCTPVILSDAWVPPTGPEWRDFAVFVPEREVASIPALLESLEATSTARGALAQQAWNDWFSDEVTFHRLVDWCLELKRGRAGRSRYDAEGLLALTERLRPTNALTTLRWLKALARQKLHVLRG